MLILPSGGSTGQSNSMLSGSSIDAPISDIAAARGGGYFEKMYRMIGTQRMYARYANKLGVGVGTDLLHSRCALGKIEVHHEPFFDARGYAGRAALASA